ncbi:hypothetical protein B0A55_02437 [Friedmanniomyces simplex]|uniref:Uncharacterized protein n=1 Tax=Friedmanniomyces simplex TaxID=329884 RepID=A0A4U0XSA6_9PEZI|nr:hypothetical protein B0A55_02437 [Friedmanniomyces simplex]
MSTQYTVDELKSLGQLCSDRLPPASAFQAMFLYEMQRQTEVEKLFQAQVFGLARADATANSTSARVQKLEAEMRKLRPQVDASDVQERLTTSKVHFTAQQAKIDACNTQLELQDQRIAALVTSFEALKAVQTVDAHAITAQEALTADMTTVQGDVEALYDERDALINMLNESNSRIQKLEDLVRQLTLQISLSTSPSNASPAMTQRLPVQNTNGQAIELAVPRGTGLSNGKENRLPARAFTPGEQVPPLFNGASGLKAGYRDTVLFSSCCVARKAK